MSSENVSNWALRAWRQRRRRRVRLLDFWTSGYFVLKVSFESSRPLMRMCGRANATLNGLPTRWTCGNTCLSFIYSFIFLFFFYNMSVYRRPTADTKRVSKRVRTFFAHFSRHLGVFAGPKKVRGEYKLHRRRAVVLLLQ